MKPTLNEQLARMQKLAGIIKENQLNKDPKVSFGKFKNVEYYKVDNELYLVVTNSDNFKEIENSMDFGDRDYLKDKEKSFLNNTVDKLADEMSNYLTSIGVKNEVGDSPIGYGQEIDNLIVVINPNDLSKLNNTQMSEGEGAYEYEKGKAAGKKIEKEKMTKSKLKEQIKEMILAELNEDSTEDVNINDTSNAYDFNESKIAEAEDGNYKLLDINDVDLGSIDVEGNIYDTGYISSAKFNNGDELSLNQRVELEDLLGKDEIAKLINLNEAKKDKEEVEDVTVDDTEVVDAPESDMMAGESAEVSGIQANLQAAYAEAKALGDEKLITQIANTITYFTKAHILDTAPINEAINDDSANAIYDILSNMDNEDIINDMFTAIQKNPEMKLEDFLNQYDAGDNPGDDNDDNYDDSMDVYDDSYPNIAEAKKAKGKLDQINENMFPMLKRILR